MGLVVHIDLAEQILADFANGLDLSPPKISQGRYLEEDEDYENPEGIIKFIYDGDNDEYE